MPVSSVILGVDLVPITPIRNVITFQADITTKECSELIENNLANWKADVVLHDGAPNIGKNWLHDSYGQNVLVVNALKIACSHLNKGGWFVTKVFRSADYNSLLWVLGKLFGKVHATKPQASRQESAEIFVVCQNYKKPPQIDPRFFDPSALFADISNFDETLRKQKADLLKPANKVKKAKAQGYEEIEALKTVSDVQFVSGNSHMDYLAQCHEIKLVNKDILAHESTTDEIKECCKDLKILGRKDLLRLLKWRRTIRQDLTSKLLKSMKERSLSNNDDYEEDAEEDNLDHVTIASDDDMDAIPQMSLDDFEANQDEQNRREARRLKKKEEKRVKDYQQRVSYGMVNQGDVLIEEEHDLFSLKSIEGKKQLDRIDDVEPDEILEVIEDPDDKLIQESKTRKSVTFSRQADVQYFELEDDYDEDEQAADDEEPPVSVESKIEAPRKIMKNKSANQVLDRLSSNSAAGGGLLTDLMDVNQSKVAAATRFFDGESFVDIDLMKEFESDMVNKIAEGRLQATSDDISNRKMSDIDMDIFDDASSSEDGSVIDPCDQQDDSLQNGLPETNRKKKQLKLDAEGLALASMMVSSKKIRKDIEDEGWNRYSHGDAHLAPKWFREEEAKHCRRETPVNPELVKEYKQRLREIDAKPIKKVMQAKARQKRRAMRKMEKVKKKVDAITSNDDMTQRERINQIRTVYKNATKSKKKEVKLVVGRKGLPTKRPGKARYKMVDSRLKKDLKAKERRENKGKKGMKKPKKSFKKRQSNNSFSSSSKKTKSKRGHKSKRK